VTIKIDGATTEEHEQTIFKYRIKHKNGDELVAYMDRIGHEYFCENMEHFLKFNEVITGYSSKNMTEEDLKELHRHGMILKEINEHMLIKVQ